MANTAFNHSPSITVPGSSTNTALVRWNGTGGKTFLDSTILVGATTMGLAADTNLLTFSSGTLTIDGTLAATTLTGALNGSQLVNDSIVEGKLNVSNAPTNGQVLTARDGVAGGFTWEAAASGGVDTTGTPADSQIAVFTDADTVEGDANLTYGSPLQGSNSKALNIVGAFADYSHGAIQIKTTHTSNTQGYNGISFYQNDNTLLATFRPGLTSNDSGSLSIGTIGNMYFSVGDPNADSSAGGRLKIYAATGDVQVKENDSMPSVTKGILKAWVQSTASGSRTGSYNVPGVIDNGTGDWQVTFEPDMESATYALAGLPINGASDIILRAADTTNADRAYVHAIVGGSKTDTAFMILAAGELT